MKVELFGWEAMIYMEIHDGTFYASLPVINCANEKVLQKYIMFLELIEFHLRELNNG